MGKYKFKIVKSNDYESIELISDWYLEEWNIAKSISGEKLKKLSINNGEFQILMTWNDEPIATGGIYNHVALLEREPKYKIHKNWLALVYSKPELRGKGLGFLICEHIQNYAKKIGLNKIYLCTYTAENLYKRLGWIELEQITIVGKKVVIMEKEL